MAWIITAFCIYAVITSLIKYKSILNPITVFYSVWGILVPLSSLGLYNMNIPSDNIYLIILIGLIGYYLGSVLGNKIRFTFGNRIRNISNSTERDAVMNYRFLYVLCTISIIYFVYMSIRVLPMLWSGRGLDYIRSLAVADEQNELRSSTLVILIKNFIATPTVYLSIALLPIELFRGKKNKLFFSMVGIMIVLWVLTTGGRSIILWEAVYFLFVYIYQRERKKKNREGKIRTRTKVILALGIVTLVYFLLQTTISRKGEGVDLLRQVCIYFVAPIEFFDIWVSKINTAYTNYHSFGFASFYGIAYPFIFVLRKIGIISANDTFFALARDLSFNALQQSLSIGKGFYMNAFATIFFQPYIDGRQIGVFLILAIFGYYAAFIYTTLIKRNDNRYLLFYLLVFQKILFSMVRFYYAQPAQSVCFLFSFFAVTYVGYRDN